MDGSLVVLFEQDRADQPGDGVLDGKKMPTTSVLRLIAPLRRSSGLVKYSLALCAAGKLI
jgi:hypothetical protein